MRHATDKKKNTFGLLLRVYSQNVDDIPKRIKMVENAISAAGPFVSRIDVLVWADKEYIDSDCGSTTSVLRARFRGNKLVHISEVKNGDLFCSVLNYGIALQTKNAVDYTIVASPEAFSYMTPSTMNNITQAAKDGALAIGVAINELTNSILEGRIANTFAAWHNLSLLTVGGFDLLAAKPKVPEMGEHVMGWSKENDKKVFYPLAGVEEVIPLARLVETFGKCIATILPSGDGVQKYETPEVSTEAYERHVRKIATKFRRQIIHLSKINTNPELLTGGILPGYPK
ncbi:MAG: hypothetical protein CL685_02590 [Candidatus Magasanikbacteria bacterium]|nr:hypothetical protein [Candidatus Magasanikbacteria bacterium]|tara:strand:+ start:1654 stop:2511 length:858 start_codon:yes stop_codon:yes gene_type:complete